MLSFMSLLLMLIPVLIGNLAFYQFKTIELNVPGMAQPSENDQVAKEEEKKPQKLENVVLQLNINEQDFGLELINEDTGESVKKENFKGDEKGQTDVYDKVIAYRKEYKKLTTILINVDNKIPYEKLVGVLDSLKKTNPEFKESLLFVLTPKGEPVEEQS